MQEFTNNLIDLSQLPKFDEVSLKKLHPKYINVLLFNFLLLFVAAIGGFSILFFFKRDAFSTPTWIGILIGILVFLGFIIFFSKLSLNKKGYAFREHDAIFKSGVISETTTIIPFNRVQHVALHQGFISRKLGLASIELFTAGGSSSDLEIPGLLLADAQNIKNLVSHKINPPVTEEINETTFVDALPELNEPNENE
ncbi:PH domain-containing protein [Flavobacterium channae]|uniref:PH domain-containing protein n=1 Tax=Flavobacterium channae TaxID=2897181 RepID=UPI001E53F2BB|nr:PH domain-containing protein [Flavobacterium channae]UGS24752.1 PH domain-containing protein [Flavobacterium channae]